MDTRRKNAPCLEAAIWYCQLRLQIQPRIDSSRNEKRLVRVNSVMQGWTEGVLKTGPLMGSASQVMLNEWNEGMTGLGLGDFPNCQLFVGLQLMAPGESRRFWIPAELAFGTNQTDPASALGISGSQPVFRYTAPRKLQSQRAHCVLTLSSIQLKGRPGVSTNFLNFCTEKVDLTLPVFFLSV